MKNKERFDKSVQILSDAYFNNELISQDCAACAVGNLIRGNGLNIISGRSIVGDAYLLHERSEESSEQWLRYLYINIRNKQKDVYLNRDVALKQIQSTGYSPEDLNRIEIAFEREWKDITGDSMFDRLMAVVEVLQQIHECSEEETTIAKGKFKKEELVSAVS